MSDDEADGNCLYTLLGRDGHTLTQGAERMYVRNEYTAGNDGLYRVISVDGSVRNEHSGSAMEDICLAIGLPAPAALACALLSTDSLNGAWAKPGRQASKLTGGLPGKQDDE